MSELFFLVLLCLILCELDIDSNYLKYDMTYSTFFNWVDSDRCLCS
jgi:hypothetical protein